MTRIEYFAAAAISGLCSGPVQIRLGGKYGFDRQAAKIAAATCDALDKLEYRESAPGKIAIRALREIAKTGGATLDKIMIAKLALEELEAEEAS